MMGWYDGGAHMFWPGWIMMAATLAVLAAGIAVGIYVLVRSRRDAAPTELGARQILDLRFARGEIDVDEYSRRRAVLDGRMPQ